MSDWIDALARLRSQDASAVIVTIASTKGSAPREAGTKMVVSRDCVVGTIGGGHLEHQAIAIAREMIDVGHAADAPLRRFALGASLGQCCGGVVNLLFEPSAGDAQWLATLIDLRTARIGCALVSPIGGSSRDKLVATAQHVHGAVDAFDVEVIARARDLLVRGESAELWNGTYLIEPIVPSDFEIVLFGAGHVGRALVRVLADIRCRIAWVDSRENAFPADLPANVAAIDTDSPEAEVDAAHPGSYFVVMTHSHATDETLTERILRRNDFAYFGLIGSQAKRTQFERRLERRGIPRARFASMRCPIGVDGIPGKEPATIAIAAAAELLQAHANALARHTHTTTARRA